MKTPLTYYGGKQQLAKFILGLIPKHKVYCEPFLGGAAIFFAKEPSKVEIVNDTNGELINFYEVLKRDFTALEKEVAISLHSRKLHSHAWVIYQNPELFDRVKRAWAIWMLANSSFGGGAYAFFDAAYVEASLGISFGGGNVETTFGNFSSSVDFALTSFHIGLLGKYPFAINESLTLFPLLGIDYQAVLSAKIDGKDYKGGSSVGGEEDDDEVSFSTGKPDDFSNLWFQLGGGVDYSFTSNIFFRGELLFGFRLPNKVELDFMREGGVTAIPGSNFTIKLAIGWRF